MNKISERMKDVILLLHKDGKERSIGWIAKEINMLYPNAHVMIERMEYRDKYVKTVRKNTSSEFGRMIKLTEKGSKLAEKLGGKSASN